MIFIIQPHLAVPSQCHGGSQCEKACVGMRVTSWHRSSSVSHAGAPWLSRASTSPAQPMPEMAVLDWWDETTAEEVRRGRVNTLPASTLSTICLSLKCCGSNMEPSAASICWISSGYCGKLRRTSVCSGRAGICCKLDVLSSLQTWLLVASGALPSSLELPLSGLRRSMRVWYM